MNSGRLIGLLLGALTLTPAALAQEGSVPIREITIHQAIQMARRSAPDLRVSSARVVEARGRLRAAAVWRDNPEIEISAGPRMASGDATVDWSVGARQRFALGGPRSDRTEVARARLQAAQAWRDNEERLLLREVALAFVEVLYWQRRVDLARESQQIAVEVSRVAQRRHQVGDVGGQDEAVASLTVSRARTEEARADGALGQAKGRLRALLGLSPDYAMVVRGDLGDVGLSPPGMAVPLAARADLRALDANARAADAAIGLGRALRVPDLTIGLEYAHEEGADILQGTVALSLPLFDRGQGTRTVSGAERARVEAEAAALRRRAAVEVATARTVLERLDTAVRAFEETGLAQLERTQQVATESYAAGAIGLGELLAIRRELLLARVEHTDLLLEAAIAQVELIASIGRWP